MNILTGTIDAIETKQNLSLVRVRVQDLHLTAIVLDTPESSDYLEIGKPVRVIFKETEVIIGAGDNHRISLRNKLPGTIQAIERGELLSRITIDTQAGAIVSIITTRSVDQLDLQTGSEVTAMVKTNEMMLSK